MKTLRQRHVHSRLGVDKMPADFKLQQVSHGLAFHNALRSLL